MRCTIRSTLGRFVVAAAALAASIGAPSASAQVAPVSVTVEAHVATTVDGAPLALRRLHVAGGIPVVLFHGLGSNGWEWDLPSRSFAGALAASGYDVWISNHRRVGGHGFRSGGPLGYGFDELVGLDIPAVVEKVIAETGERPFLVGHSLGGMMIQGYLQGAAYESSLVSRRLRIGRGGIRLEDVYAPRIEGRDARAAARNSTIRGAVVIAGPPRLDWPAAYATVADAWRYEYWDYNILLRDLSWSPNAIAAAYATEELPQGRVVAVLTDDLPRFPYAGPRLHGFLMGVAQRFGRSFLFAQAAYGPNMDPVAIQEGLGLAADNLSTGVLRQFMDAIRARELRETHVRDALRRPHVYSDHYDRVTAPILFVGGRYDKLCNDDTLMRSGFGRVSSTDRTYLGLDYGHVDLVIGRDAPRDVWAPIHAWLAARR